MIYDEATKKGIAIIGVNNPHKTEAQLCPAVEEVGGGGSPNLVPHSYNTGHHLAEIP